MSDEEIEIGLNGLDGAAKDRAIVAALSGDNPRSQSLAVKKLLDQLRPMLIHYVKQNSGTKEQGVDLANDVVCVLYENIQRGKYQQQDSAKLSGYCYRIGMNLWLKGIRDDDDLSLDDDNPKGGPGNTPPNEDDPTGPFDDVDDGNITSPAMQKAWRAFKKLELACQRMVRLELDGVIDEEVLMEYPGMTAEQLRTRRLGCKKEWLRLIKKEPTLVLKDGMDGPCLEHAYAGLTPGQRKLLDLDRDGLSETGIQAAFGYKSLGAVRVNRARAKGRLKEIYAKCMNGHGDKPSDGAAE